MILNTLGAAQYRAGHDEEAIKTLEEGIKSREGKSGSQDWAFQAMAHHRLGNHDEARRWLDRFKTWKRDESGFSWGSLEIKLLEREARQLVLEE